MVTDIQFMRSYMSGDPSIHQLVTNNQAFTKKVVAGRRAFQLAHARGLVPTPYFFEALDYVRKAKKLQAASLAGKKVPKVGDPLMEAIPIYNTVERRYAGFSNALELLWYGKAAPKVVNGQHAHRLPPIESWSELVPKSDKFLHQWMFITLAHRITGSGASFEHDHGFRNSHVVDMSTMLGGVDQMAAWLANRPGPIFTSIGNQIAPFNKPTGTWKSGGREYLAETAPELVERVHTTLSEMARITGGPMGIKPAVDTVLSIQRSMGHRQFKFVLTAWVMDMAEYLPHLVDADSDCYHGKNAIEAMNICFDRLPSMKLQDFYDTATRLFADVTGTKPMDVEDASPGCDFVRWIESYVPRRGFDHVRERGIFNGSSLLWKAGRQPST